MITHDFAGIKFRERKINLFWISQELNFSNREFKNISRECIDLMNHIIEVLHQNTIYLFKNIKCILLAIVPVRIFVFFFVFVFPAF